MLINKTHEESEEPHPSKKKLKSNLKTFCLEQKKNLDNEKGLFFSYEQKKAESWMVDTCFLAKLV